MTRYLLFSIFLSVSCFCSAQLRVWADGKTDKPDFEMMPQLIDSITFVRETAQPQPQPNPDPEPDPTPEPEPTPDPEPEPDPDPQPSEYPELTVKTGYATLCFHITAPVCQDMVWAGVYNDWQIDPAAMIHFAAVKDWDGWYTADIPLTEGIDNKGKIVHLAIDGLFNWGYQAAETTACYILKGESTCYDHAGGGTQFILKESNEPTYVMLTQWLNNPCDTEYTE